MVKQMADPKEQDRIASNYFTEVGLYPLPTKEEEVRLFKAYARARELEEISMARASEIRNQRSPTWKSLAQADELEKSAEAYRAEKEQVGKQIATGYLRFVMRLANRRTKDPVLQQELISEGNVGLMIGLNRFDVTRGTRFLTFGAFWIKVCMDEYMNRSLTVHVPSHTRKEIRRRKREEDVMFTTGAIRQSAIVEPTVGPLDPGHHADANACTDSTVMDNEQNLLRHMDLAQLSQREKLILVYRFGLRDAPTKTIDEMTQLFYEIDGTCLLPEDIRAIQTKAMQKLKGHLHDQSITAAADML